MHCLTARCRWVGRPQGVNELGRRHSAALGDRQQRKHCAALRPAYLNRAGDPTRVDHEAQWAEQVDPNGNQ